MGHVAERLEPKAFTLGGTGAADYRDLLIYRSALNADEAAALEDGKLLQASLEIYSPLADIDAHSAGAVRNLAQSLSAAHLAGRASHIEK